MLTFCFLCACLLVSLVGLIFAIRYTMRSREPIGCIMVGLLVLMMASMAHTAYLVAIQLDKLKLPTP